ncbi:MAG: phage integrase N-terminal SAM-like domain-containing protein, partial [Bacteroidota bacterium]
MDEKQRVTTYLQQKGCSKNSIQTYVRNLVRFMKWLKSKNIESENVTYPELLDYISHLRNQG